MHIARLFSLAGLIGFILLFAAGGNFHAGILIAVVLTLLIGFVEPTPAN